MFPVPIVDNERDSVAGRKSRRRDLLSWPQAASKRAWPVKTRQQKHGHGTAAAAGSVRQAITPFVASLSRADRAAATALPLVHIRTAGAAGKLNVGFWDHWVPNGTEAMRKQVMAWADKNKVEVQPDSSPRRATNFLLTAAAEAQSKTGHDFIPFFQWDVLHYADNLEPVDDVVKYLTSKYGIYDPVIEYLAE